MEHKTNLWFCHERLVFGLVFILSVTGIFAWFSINEQEDPFFPYRNGFITIVAPGLSPSAIESSVVLPVERALSGVDELGGVDVQIAEGVAMINLELKEAIYDTRSAWQRVREQMQGVESEFSSIVTEFKLHDRAQDTAGILLAIDTKLPLLKAREYALSVRDHLYKLEQIRKIEIIGASDQQIQVLFPQSSMIELGLSPIEIAEQIADANSLKSTGTLLQENYLTSISPVTRIDSIDALNDINIKLADGNVSRLAQIATVVQTPAVVETESFRVNSKPAIGLSIVVPPNQIRSVEFGEELLAIVEQLNAQQQAFTLRPIFFQPQWTKERRDGLSQSLLIASMGGGIVLFLLMSPTLAAVVSVTIPAIALTSIALFGMLGGVLEQMSIAGLVISLGLMVDNSIVMSELIAKYRSYGMSSFASSRRAISELAKPLATSTITTIAAFVPLLLSKGSVADFVRMIPVMVILAILTSYFYALVLLPTMTNKVKNFHIDQSSRWFHFGGEKVARLSIQFPKVTIVTFVVLAVMLSSLAGGGKGEFFPKSSRNQVIIDIEGSFGSSFKATDSIVQQVERYIRDEYSIKSLTSFVGNSGPRFYYNLSESPNAPYIARVVVETNSSQEVADLVKKFNQSLSDKFASTRIRARQIGQGPPIEAPIEVRVLGDDRTSLLAAAEDIFTLIDTHPDTVDSRRNYIIGKPSVEFDVIDEDLMKSGISRTELSNYIRWRSTGIESTKISTQQELLPVVVVDKVTVGSRNIDELMSTVLISQDHTLLPVSLFIEPKLTAQAPILSRKDGFKSFAVKADVVDSADEEQVLETLMTGINDIEQKYDVMISLGGEAEEEGESNDALIKALPAGIILLFSALMIQFNSYRIAALVLITIPMALIGVAPALSMVGLNFGFMALLGVLALTGIVVNTAIILVDCVITNIRTRYMTLAEAIEHAVKDRFRPVMLTAVTTTVGMIPLTSPESPLWPPMAWTMIGGMVTSTVLTLIVFPAILLVTLNESKIKTGS
ncbi:efflux RND transporter permease subunit [Thalassotalea marina]|uniref:ACR family transporter n=1 Tax=Thalassotalea marina TaxID=1673741 RepID=A0A919BLS8_9GAMM|nr:efflux RND transporter permease subunit [Thalassotalea marina]GHF97647.1 ACR family transporter [Thalassotalea marina]